MSKQQPSFHEAGLEVLASGLNLAELDLHGGDAFWNEVHRYTRESHLEEVADRCLAGKSAPRLWAVVEAPAAGPAAVATALGLATVLADRGQAVVLLDGDEQEPRLTRWIGRIEQEGWIDMVRFGASLHASSAPLPSDNRRGSVVGVGSFAPTGITAAEVAELLGRLRHQADDVVMVLPAKLRSQPWLAAAHIRLLCWDLLSRGGDDTRTIVEELERMGGRPAFIVGFGVEEFSAIQQHLSEEAAAAPADPPADPAPVDQPSSAVAGMPSSDPATPDATPTEPEEAVATEAPRRRTSGIFVFTALAAVACLALVGWFLVDQQRGADGPMTQPPPVVVAERPVDVVDQEADRPAGDDVVDDAVVSPEGSTEVPGAVAADQPADAVPEPETPGETIAPAEEAEAPAAEADHAAAFDPEPFRRPVGEAGWALWIYSLPDEGAAAVELRELERRGLVGVTREMEIKDRGRWHRVYTGSFATRAEAAAAAEGLKAALRHDWAVPSRF